MQGVGAVNSTRTRLATRGGGAVATNTVGTDLDAGSAITVVSDTTTIVGSVLIGVTGAAGGAFAGSVAINVTGRTSVFKAL